MRNDHPRDDDAALLARLTPRERQILELMAEGYDRDELAEALGTTPSTIRTHRNNIHHKLGVSSALKAVALLNRVSRG